MGRRAWISHGFTVIELMIAIAIIGILLAVATPSLQDAFMSARMTNQANDLMADLALARTEAVKRGVGVFLCPSPAPYTSCSGTAWTAGWAVFPDDNRNNVWDNIPAERLLKTRPAVQAGNTIQVCGATVAGGTSYVPYWPSGVSSTVANANPVTFVMCDSRTAAGRGRQITITATGRANVTRITCPVTC